MNFVNNLHPNLEFTHEIEPKQLTFLDTEKYLPSDLRCVYASKGVRKVTITDIFVNLYAICPWILKYCLINCFLN